MLNGSKQENEDEVYEIHTTELHIEEPSFYDVKSHYSIKKRKYPAFDELTAELSKPVVVTIIPSINLYKCQRILMLGYTKTNEHQMLRAIYRTLP